MKSKRNLRLDLFKAFAIIAIVLWHFSIIPTWSFIWAIPLFIFVTASAYNNRLGELKFKKIIINFIEIALLIFLVTITLMGISAPTLLTTKFNSSLTGLIQFFILRNPYLGHLWYFILYFQILILIFLISYIKGNHLKKPLIGFVLLSISIVFSYILLFNFGQGLTINCISWVFLIWLGVYYFADISEYFKKQKTISLLVYILLGTFTICLVLIFGGEGLFIFLSERTHDFIFPTNLMQLGFFIIIFSITELMMRHSNKTVNTVISMIGRNSLYIYIFHDFLYRIIFKHYFGLLGIVITLISCVSIGELFHQIKIALKNEK